MKQFLQLLLATTSPAIPAAAQALPATEQSPASVAEQAPQSGTSVPIDEVAIGDIVVTAQKRAQRVNSIGMSIQALDDDALTRRGVQNVADLVKAVPGFTYAPSPFQTPVYTLRGVGVFEASFATSPAVTVYIDEVPLPYPIMQQGVGLDLERVEVLKGPQGTLFGGSSTGGAINYIAAKPTDVFKAGFSATAARFGEANLSGFVSGPLGESLNVRLSAAANTGGAWQRSVSRPGDRNGARDFYQARLLADLQASDRLSLKFNINGFYDNSQVQAPQLKGLSPSLLDPALPDPAAGYAGNPNVPADFFTGPLTPATTPRLVGNSVRDADWNPDWHDNRRSNRFIQAGVRADYELTDELTATSLTSYGHIKQDNYVPLSATALPIFDVRTYGTVETFNQELRVAGDMDRVNWVLGGSYSYTDADERNSFHLPGALFGLFDFRGFDSVGALPSSLAQLFHTTDTIAATAQRVNEYAVFGNVEYKVVDQLTLQAGLRYTRNNRNAVSCDVDSVPTEQFGRIVEALQYLLKGSFVPIPQGTCFTLNSNLNPAPVFNTLNEDNLSWRVGLNYEFADGALIYANASRGYKAGAVAVFGAFSDTQLRPITQERLDAYEAGIKMPVGRDIQLNGAAFLYKYKDKQVRGRVNADPFGFLETLINVPKSEIYGFELSADARPVPGLTVSAAATYLNSKVKGRYVTLTQAALFGDIDGSTLPYTPKWSVTADAEYGWSVFGTKRAFVGASMLYHSVSSASFETPALPAPGFALPAYTTLDLRAGIAGEDDSWRVTVFGRNVTNAYYLTGVFNPSATRYAYAGLPATYGATVAFSF